MTPFSRVLKAPHGDGRPRVVSPVHFAPVPGNGGQPSAGEHTGDGSPVTPAQAGGPPEAQVQAARQEAERLLAEARAEASALLAQAHERAMALEAEARERGFQAGLEAAREAQRALLADLETHRAQLEAERDRFFEGLEPEVVRLALGVAERIIRQEVDLHPEIVVGVARAALSRLREARSVRVAAHPADVDLLRQHLSELPPGGPAEVAVYPNAGISRGGCQIDSDRGSADGRLEAQLERVAAALQEWEL